MNSLKSVWCGAWGVFIATSIAALVVASLGHCRSAIARKDSLTAGKACPNFGKLSNLPEDVLVLQSDLRGEERNRHTRRFQKLNYRFRHTGANYMVKVRFPDGRIELVHAALVSHALELRDERSYGEFIWLYKRMCGGKPSWSGQIAFQRKKKTAEVREATRSLFYRASSGDPEGVRASIRAGATINGKNANGDTALIVAARAGHEEIVALLKELGADPSIRDSGGKTAADILEARRREQAERERLAAEKRSQLQELVRRKETAETEYRTALKVERDRMDAAARSRAQARRRYLQQQESQIGRSSALKAFAKAKRLCRKVTDAEESGRQAYARRLRNSVDRILKNGFREGSTLELSGTCSVSRSYQGLTSPCIAPIIYSAMGYKNTPQRMLEKLEVIDEHDKVFDVKLRFVGGSLGILTFPPAMVLGDYGCTIQVHAQVIRVSNVRDPDPTPTDDYSPKDVCVQGDCKNGNGVFVYWDGRKYSGEWRDGKSHGRGVLFNKEGGIVYVGEFRQGSPEGEGAQYYENGSAFYVGQWKNGKKHGNGATFGEDGSVKLMGEWSSGQFSPRKRQ